MHREYPQVTTEVLGVRLGQRQAEAERYASTRAALEQAEHERRGFTAMDVLRAAAAAEDSLGSSDRGGEVLTGSAAAGPGVSASEPDGAQPEPEDEGEFTRL